MMTQVKRSCQVGLKLRSITGPHINNMFQTNLGPLINENSFNIKLARSETVMIIPKDSDSHHCRSPRLSPIWYGQLQLLTA